MDMNTFKLVIAAAVAAAFSAPALADPPLNTANLSNVTSVTNQIKVSGDVAVDGKIDVAAEVGAVTDNSQASVGNLVITVGGGNDADLTGSASGLTGNVGINVAAGTGNAQGNEAALASLQDADKVFASAQTFSSQVSGLNANVALLTNNTANMTGSLTGITGNVGANIASGSGNMQDNQLAAAVGSSGSNASLLPPPPPHNDQASYGIAKASGSNQQLVGLTLNGDGDWNMTNTAAITNSLSGSGNIGANVAAGYGNLQHNSLSIAAAK
jgi:hypothetical protein